MIVYLKGKGKKKHPLNSQIFCLHVSYEDTEQLLVDFIFLKALL